MEAERGSARRRASVLAYVTSVAAMSVLASVLLARGFGPPSVWTVVVFWFLHAAADSAPIKLPAGSLSAGFLVLMTAALATNPVTASLVGFASALSRSEWRRTRDPVRMIFNAAQGALYTGGASAAYWTLREALGTSAWTALAGTALAAAIAFVLNTGLVAGVLALDRRKKLAGTWRQLLWPAPNYAGFAFAALAVAAVYARAGVLAALFLVTPLLVLRAAHRGFLELETARRRTMQAFARAVELKDPETRGHSERVAEVAREMFRELGIEGTRLDRLYEGSLLHDLGKVAVSGSILTKPAALDAAEYEHVKKHPSVGASVVRTIDHLAESVPLILFHHERLDGGGYPWGLRAEAIPFEARVLAVADTFDALTTNRPFRLGRSVTDAMAEIRRCTPRQLDPAAVEALERLLGRGHQFPVPLRSTSRRPLEGWLKVVGA